MNLNETREVLKSVIEAKAPVTPMLWGPHGIGKSSIVRQVGVELNKKVLSLILSQKEAVDIAGVLYTYEDPELKMSVTSSHPPDWFAKAIKEGDLILFLDEFNMARREVMAAAFELILDRKLNNIKLPDSVSIICAGNPEDERYDVTSMSESLVDRLMHLKVEANVDTWLKYAKGAGNISENITNYIQVCSGSPVHQDKKDAKFPVKLRPSFRSWERASMIHELKLSEQLEMECLSGIVGSELALGFQKFIQAKKEEHPLSAEEITKMNATTLKKFNSWVDGKTKRIDLVNASITNLVAFAESDSTKFLKFKNDKVVSNKKIEGVKKFLLALPNDAFMTAATKLCKISTDDEALWADYFVYDKEILAKLENLADVINEADKTQEAEA